MRMTGPDARIGELLRNALAVLCALLAIAQPAAAEESLYIGVAAAFSRAEIDVDKTTASIGQKWVGSPTEVDKKGDGLKVYGGWQLHRYLALELGYTDFGRVSTYSTLLASTSRDTASVQWDGYGIDVSALGTWRIGDVFSLYARGGASFWDIDRKIVEDGTAGHISRSASDSGVAPLAGVGRDIRFVAEGTLRVEFQRYFRIGSKDVGGERDIDMLSIGAHYHF
jgi:OmpA-OmpF porin, OOP family